VTASVKREPNQAGSSRIDEPEPLNVLIVDYSVGFGGAIKSLALTLTGLPDLRAIIVTSQSAAAAERWFPNREVLSFRRHVNYASRERLLDHRWVRGFRGIASRLWSAVDWCVELVGSIKIARLILLKRINLVHLNNGFVPREAFRAVRWTGRACVVHLRDFAQNVTAGEVVERDIDCVIAVSNAVAGSITAPDLRSRARVVYDPVDTELVRRSRPARETMRRSFGLGDASIAVGIFGRVIPWKGQRLFVEAVVDAMAGHSGLIGLIVGDEADGGREYFDEIRQFIDQSGFANRFVLTGYRPDVEALYAAMDIVVHASITPEPFGMVLPEAMVAGCAVIGADAGGPREIVQPNVTGLLFSPGNRRELAEAISRLVTDVEFRARLAAAGAVRAADQFSIARNSSAVREAYLAALRSNRSLRDRG
jgi:glycosyltransferase involved in cell wall biosynthesis